MGWKEPEVRDPIEERGKKNTRGRKRKKLEGRKREGSTLTHSRRK